MTSSLEVALWKQALAGVRTALETALIEELDAELGFAPYARGPVAPGHLTSSGRATFGVKW